MVTIWIFGMIMAAIILIVEIVLIPEEYYTVRDIYAAFVLIVLWPAAFFYLLEENVLSDKFLNKVIWRRKK